MTINYSVAQKLYSNTKHREVLSEKVQVDMLLPGKPPLLTFFLQAKDMTYRSQWAFFYCDLLSSSLPPYAYSKSKWGELLFKKIEHRADCQEYCTPRTRDLGAKI